LPIVPADVTNVYPAHPYLLCWRVLCQAVLAGLQVGISWPPMVGWAMVSGRQILCREPACPGGTVLTSDSSSPAHGKLCQSWGG
jgi:hypothetical protein